MFGFDSEVQILIQLIKKEVRSVDEFVTEIAGISDSLVVVGDKVTNCELVMSTLFSLG